MRLSSNTAVAAALVGVGAITVLTGCATGPVSPTPDPSASGVAACDLAEAKVTWEKYQQDVPTEVGYRVINVDGETSATDDTMFGYQSRIVGSADDRLPPADDAWLEFLIDDFNRTGQLEFFDVGDPPADPAEFPTFDAPAHPGTYVVGFTTEQMYVPFSVECDGKTVSQGQLVTNDTGHGLGSTLVECGSPLSVDTELGQKLLGYCPT